MTGRQPDPGSVGLQLLQALELINECGVIWSFDEQCPQWKTLQALLRRQLIWRVHYVSLSCSLSGRAEAGRHYPVSVDAYRITGWGQDALHQAIAKGDL